ncbi:hypothetical protein [Paenibacillus prosopidis]|uniref:Uncharacterized protein n=1 Tax=Paenibacillus prosopidis TaxID=630520 RepID=A0A368VPU6_9BACL|nr:hypothetical protein [Paenibacillus prosopidis]RCW43524.1 hypothetical protein DFP97_113198 [Paenibacillus prosopidis]
MEALNKRVAELQEEMQFWSNIELLVEFERLVPYEGKNLRGNLMETFCEYKAVRAELHRRLDAYDALKK